jgi:hypothetical protein
VVEYLTKFSTDNVVYEFLKWSDLLFNFCELSLWNLNLIYENMN